MIVEQGLIILTVGISGLSLATALVHAWHVRPTHVERPGVATLLMALTGEASGLERLIRALEKQTLKPRRLVVGMESDADPAFRAAQRLIDPPTGFPVEIVIAGPAAGTAQKCLNLIAASRRIDAEDEVIVLLDGDIVPPPWWLSALVSPIKGDYCDIVTGYRWPMIERHTFGAHIIVAIDRTVAILPRLRGTRAVWGGTLAMSRRAYRLLDLEHTLQSTLSDDLAIGTVAADRGLRVLTRRSLLIPSPVAYDFVAAWKFGRRQYQMMRLYRPQLWTLALVTMSAQLTGWGIIVSHLGTSWFPRVALAILLLFVVVKQALLDWIGGRLGHPDRSATRTCQLSLALAKPVVDGVHLSMILAAARTSTINWGHITYRLESASHISIRDRKPWCGSSV